MSVRPITSQELGNVYANLAVRQRLLGYAGVDEQELQEVLRTIQVANRAAWAMTYGDQLELEDVEFSGTVEQGLTDQELFSILGNLVYNCISNGGKLFLPREQWQAVNRLRLAIVSAHFEDEAVGDGPRRGRMKKIRR